MSTPEQDTTAPNDPPRGDAQQSDIPQSGAQQGDAQQSDHQSGKKKFLIDVLFAAVILGLVYLFLRYLVFWVLPFVIAFFVALILQKPVRWLTEKTRLPRWIWSGALVLTLLAALTTLLVFLIFRIGSESIGFISWVASKGPDIKEALQSVIAEVNRFVASLPQELQSTVQNSPSAVIDRAVSAVTGFLWDATKSIVTAVPELLVGAVITTVAACFMTADYPRITAFLLAQCSAHGQAVILKAKSLFFKNILRMLRGYLLIMLITFGELFLGFLLLRIDYAAILALLIAILDIFPIVGTGTVLIPWGIVDLVIGKTGAGIGLIVLYAVITVVRNVIEPKIISDQVGLPPLVTLIAMYAGLRIFGGLGLFGLPILLIILNQLQEAGLIHLWNSLPKEEKKKRSPPWKRKKNAQKEG